MLELLDRLREDLPAMLDEPWSSLHIDYHPPVVDRLWKPWGDYRVYLHRIHPCAEGEALFHPHPWPSVMEVLHGKYEMAIGYGAGANPPPFAARMIVSGGNRYEMTTPDGWHYVRPIDSYAWTIMITGKPWSRWSPSSHKPLAALNPTTEQVLLSWYRTMFSR